jgi:RND family efflux transporter MFP subunit
LQRRRVWITAGLVLVGLAAAAAGWRWWPVAVDVVPVQRGLAVEAVYATGVVEPTVQIPVAPRAGGRLVAWEVEEGATVRRGQVLARLEADDLDRTVQEMAAREQLARTNLERTQQLVAQQFLSPAELDRTRIEWQAAQAALRRAEALRNYSQLVAPADGVVLRRDGERGQFIPAGQTVYTLACCAPLRVAAEVDEEDIARVRVGMPVVMRSDALPTQVFDGSVAEITPKGDPVARSYRVRIRFQDTPVPDVLGSSGLRSGMTMDANLVIARREQALLVPTRAVQGTTAWRVVDGHAVRRTLTLGAKGAERTEVLLGLDEGDRVIVAPPATLREGLRVTPR